ncbi:MAG TPA: hypothetical protein VGF79_15715 [Bacteroidia bacterium]
MCETNWTLIKKFKSLDIISGTPTFNASNQLYKNRTYGCDFDFTLAINNAKNGGDYNLVVTKLTEDDVVFVLPDNSLVSGSDQNSFDISGPLNSKFWFNFTFDGFNFIWTLKGSSSGSGSTTPDSEILDAAAAYSDFADTLILASAKSYCDSQLLNIPEVVDANYTFVLTDKDKLKIMNAETPQNFIVPTNLSVPFPIGTRIHTSTKGLSGITSFLAEGGVSIKSADNFLRLRTRYACATIIKTAVNEWLLTGDLSL